MAKWDAPAGGGSKWGTSKAAEKEEPQKKKKKSNILDVLQAPQQMVSHLIKGVRTRDVGELGEAAKSAAKFTVPGAAFAPVTDQAPLSFTETVGAKKLPFGVETLGTIATDPATYLTFGTGAVAKSALKSIEKAAGPASVQAIRQQGLKALTPTQQKFLRQNFYDEAVQTVGPKKANKIADTKMQSLKSRARGGVGLHIPGTKLDLHVAGSFEGGPLRTAATKSPKYSAVRKAVTGEDLAEPARVAQGTARMQGQTADSLAETASRWFDKTEFGKNLAGRVEKLAEPPVGEAGALSKAWRRMAVTYPGTVVNRLRQAAFYGAAEGMRPDQWTRNMTRGLKNYKASEELAKEMGISGTEEMLRGLNAPAFAQRLAAKIGPQAAREELAFREFGEAPTLFTGLNQAAPTTKLGKVVEKGRLLKKGGEAIRGAGNAVEESSRRANFLHNLETRYGSFEEAGAHTRHVLPGVKAHSEAERQLGKILPFWTAMRADWQAVLRQMGESPGRVSALTRAAGGLEGSVGLPGGAELDVGKLKERHMPPLELAEMLNVPLNLAQGELDEALLAFSEMTGGPAVAIIEQGFEAWRRKNQDVPPQEQWYRFLRAVNPYLQRLPSATEKVLSGREENLTKADKSAMEAFIRFVSGLDVRTGATEEGITETPGARKKTETKAPTGSKWN